MTLPAFDNRLPGIKTNRCGRSGILLPAISLGLWHNFGGVDDFKMSSKLICGAFDRGVTHFDLANNYGPPPGSAERTFGQILKGQLAAHRDELIIATKAGYRMWSGPYGDGGSRKYLVASLDQSLKRMGLDYVDIFYSHRHDPDTPLEETMSALDLLVRQGKTLYAATSTYPPDRLDEAIAILEGLGTPCLAHQISYSMFNRSAEDGLFDVLGNRGVGCIAFSPLAQGLLAGRYRDGIPKNSRAAKSHGFLQRDQVTESLRQKTLRLEKIAADRGQTVAQMALAWVLRDGRVQSAIVGVSGMKQLEENLACLNRSEFSTDEIGSIERILKP